MHKFSLFEKSNKFYWSTNRVIYSIYFVGLGILLLKKEVFHFENDIFDDVLFFIMIATFICAFFTMLIGMDQVKPLRGKLEGYIIFDENYIEIKEEKFPIGQIKKIQISNDDYVGKPQVSRGNFGPALSNGINNFIVIFLESGNTKRIQYELCNSNDFQKMREILIDYHLIGKIDYWELAQVLGEKSTSEALALTNEIERRSSIVNTRL